MPDRVGQLQLVATRAVDGGRFLIAPPGKLAAPEVPLDLTQSRKRLRQIDWGLGLARKVHSLRHVPLAVGQPTSPPRLICPHEQFIDGQGFITRRLEKWATVPGPTQSPTAPLDTGCFRSFTISAGCVAPCTNNCAWSPLTTTLTGVHSSGCRSTYDSYFSG